MKIHTLFTRIVLITSLALGFMSPASAAPPQWESNIGGALAALTGYDDEETSVSLSFSFPFAGNSYSTVYVGTNGCVQLGSLGTDGDIDYDHWEYLEEFLDDAAPELCVANMDWDLSTRGTVHFADLGNRAVFTWNRIGSNATESSISTFQIIMYQSGLIVFNYNGLFTQSGGSLVNDTDVGIVVGITASNNVTPAPIDLSAGGSFSGFTGFQAWCYDTANTCGFEDRADVVNGPTNASFDLDNTSLCFSPLPGNTGYSYGPGACVARAPSEVPGLASSLLAVLSALVLLAFALSRRRSAQRQMH